MSPRTKALPTRILLVDDHPIFRAGLKALVEMRGDAVVVGTASSAEAAVDLVRRLDPDVVVMDLALADSDGLEATRRIRALGLDAKVLVLTAQAMDDYLLPVLDAGASGYLPKSAGEDSLLDAVSIVAAGEVYLPPRAARMLVTEHRTTRSEESEALRELSLRDREVLALTAGGFSAREIAEKLLVSSKTVDSYRTRITGRLGLESRSDLVRFALRNGLLKGL